MDEELHILQTWMDNARPWIKAIGRQEIESRKLVTDAAIVQAICALKPQSVWDIGCGEGWLSRQLATKGMQVNGTDAIALLIEKAIELGGAQYQQASYQDIVEGRYQPPHPVDAAVFNFALFGNELVQQLLQAIRPWINNPGHLLIQTLHPFAAAGDEPYTNGWRQGSWQGFSKDFVNPAPWYFRTMEGWISTLHNSGYKLCRIKEPVHPQTQMPLSLILMAKPDDA